MAGMEGDTEDMLKVSEQELLWMNQVTRGPAPFGVYLKYPANKGVEEMKAHLTESLKGKGILDKSGRLSRYGTTQLMLWEEYRRAERHLVVNGVLLAILENGRMVAVRKDGTDYYMTATWGHEVLLSLLKELPFLRQGEEEQEKVPSCRLSYEEWSKKMQEEGWEVLFTGSFRGYEPEKEVAYCWKDGSGCQYDLNREWERSILPRQMRLRLMELLEVRREEAVYGKHRGH